ncbi:hypothetical protein NG798_17045 [Ancylothrix sp. C2]|uniref:hypothetical protein n=1 Tax=Ancylothrix sp. D3o TaxID=2953691 RepID=UPI0021BB9978|nr:hypothetical protein [Ancylothrix sp. D3o]MCT7951512.1 hypothetical protein [Ancylothrix sp. D3o]
MCSAVICLICGGEHRPELTDSFVKQVFQAAPSASLPSNVIIFPSTCGPVWSPFHVLQFLEASLTSMPSEKLPAVIFISFSAGVAGAIGAAWGWQQRGGKVAAFFGLDGWGVPLAGDFPIYRLSHDYFTHWTSALLGTGDQSFYGTGATSHLQLWDMPQTVQGWWYNSASFGLYPVRPTTAALFLVSLLERHGAFLSPTRRG